MKPMPTNTNHRVTGGLLLALALVIVLLAGREFRAQLRPDAIFPSPAMTGIHRLSEFNPLLAGSPGDTDIYVFEGREPGGTLLVLGGTHATEISGVMTAVLMVETLEVRAGRVLVIPRANASAATHTMAREAHPSHIEIPTQGGVRRFRYGARFSNLVHQKPDPLVFRHPASPRILQGREARNLNRVYPGVQDGTLTERVAWAIVELIRHEDVNVAFDLHEAPPDRNLVNAIVATESGTDIAAEATILLQLEGTNVHLESSSTRFRGLSHREWEDATEAIPFLMETGSPVQGRLRGRTDGALAVTGRDHWYQVAAQKGWLAMPYDERGIPLESRVARHLAGILAILEIYNAKPETRPILLEGLPPSRTLQEKGLGFCLGMPDKLK